jgi:hypothetical protein
VSTTRLRITLRDVRPAVTRVLDVPVSTTLPELHDLLQAAVGWSDSHLHQFVAGEQRWGVPSEDSWDDQELDETAAALKDLPARFDYLYDFGDSWEHEVEVLGRGAAAPGLVEGEGACPPEDCGGVSGYEELRLVLADPQHEDYEHLRSWSAHHRFVFDLTASAALVQQILGVVPEPVRALLDLIGPGLKLTAAGRMPPATVAALLGRFPRWNDLHRGPVREDSVPQAWALKDLMREVGLLRLSRGVLSPTKAAASDAEIVRRLRRRFPDGDFETLLASNGLAVLAVSGPMERSELIARLLPMMGRWAVNGQPMDAESMSSAWSGIWRYLTALELIEDDGWRGPTALGPSGLTLLPRAAGLADTLRRYDASPGRWPEGLA